MRTEFKIYKNTRRSPKMRKRIDTDRYDTATSLLICVEEIEPNGAWFLKRFSGKGYWKR